jgi:hypothetical protein
MLTCTPRLLARSFCISWHCIPHHSLHVCLSSRPRRLSLLLLPSPLQSTLLGVSPAFLVGSQAPVSTASFGTPPRVLCISLAPLRLSTHTWTLQYWHRLSSLSAFSVVFNERETHGALRGEREVVLTTSSYGYDRGKWLIVDKRFNCFSTGSFARQVASVSKPPARVVPHATYSSDDSGGCDERDIAVAGYVHIPVTFAELLVDLRVMARWCKPNKWYKARVIRTYLKFCTCDLIFIPSNIKLYGVKIDNVGRRGVLPVIVGV